MLNPVGLFRAHPHLEESEKVQGAELLRRLRVRGGVAEPS